MSHIFETPDGTLIEVRSLNSIECKLSTCGCDLVYEGDTEELDFAIKVCQEHKSVADAALVSSVLAHSRALNQRLGTGVVLTDAQKDIIASDQDRERQRIEALGAVEVRADSTTKNAIESDLRSKGR